MLALRMSGRRCKTCRSSTLHIIASPHLRRHLVTFLRLSGKAGLSWTPPFTRLFADGKEVKKLIAGGYVHATRDETGTPLPRKYPPYSLSPSKFSHLRPPCARGR